MKSRRTVHPSRRSPGRGPRFVLCIANPRHPSSLEVRKVYRVRADRSAHSLKMLRVVDESGEDYLFPAKWFAPVDLSRAAARVFTNGRR